MRGDDGCSVPHFRFQWRSSVVLVDSYLVAHCALIVNLLKWLDIFLVTFEQDYILELCSQSFWLQLPCHKSLGICCIVNNYFQYGKFFKFLVEEGSKVNQHL
jgi:hypothetical protein